MAKVTRAHIIAARARRDILKSQKKPVPPKIVKLADLDITKFPRSAALSSARETLSTMEVDPVAKGWLTSHFPLAGHYRPFATSVAKEESVETGRHNK